MNVLIPTNDMVNDYLTKIIEFAEKPPSFESVRISILNAHVDRTIGKTHTHGESHIQLVNLMVHLESS